MKTLLRILLCQLCCFPLLITDAMARDGERGGKGNKSGTSKKERPNVRPSQSQSRNPITHSKTSKPADRPSPKPAERPSSKPQPRPEPKPNRPESKPNRPDEKPNRPDDKPNRPDDKPNRPDDKPNRPDDKPNRPNDKPNRPDEKPNRPAELPNRKPEKPSDRPGNKPGDDKPGRNPDHKNPNDKKPGKPELPYRPNRPETRPATKPGQVNYPKADRPGSKDKDKNKNRDRYEEYRPTRKPEVKPGKNTRPVRRPEFNSTEVNVKNKNTHNQWWSSNKNVYNNNKTHIHGGNTYVNVNNNFKKNVNWSTDQKHWGYNPWWNRPATRPWYGGSWNCGWNNSYHHHHHTSYYYSGYYGYRPPGYVVYHDHDDNDVAQAIGWGLVGWGLGKLIFDTGYQTYSNPYPAQPVTSSSGTQVTYTEPITVVAAKTAPAEADAEKLTALSESHVSTSQEAFKQGDYLRALDFANKAVAEAPGDGALHEYRALVLFSLGRFSEAAGVLNPVLAGGPGWDWTTMIGLYRSQDTYMKQLEALQNYSDSKPQAADACFLLGYHYMVCGHLEEATAEFEKAARLQPADTVSAQLRDLTKASSNKGDEETDESAEDEAETPPPPAPVPLEKLTGTWVSDKGAQGTVTLAFKDDGKFIWNFTKDQTSNEFGGDFSMNDSGLLVLDSEESQMVASLAQPQDNQLKFTLSGGPPGDPGMIFTRK